MSEMLELADRVTNHLATLAATNMKLSLTEWGVISNDILSAADALRRCSADSAEPVAWRWKFNGQWFFGPRHAPQEYPSEPLYVHPEPLYAHPTRTEPQTVGGTVITSADWQNAKVSIDVSTGDDDAGHRIFGRVIDWQPQDWIGDKGVGLNLLCEYESDNFGMRSQAESAK